MNRTDRSWSRATAAVGMLACIVTGCAGAELGEQGVGEEQVQSSTEALFQANGITLWTSNNGVVPVCFNGRENSVEAGWMKTALQNAWSAVAKIDFVYSNTCPFVGKTNWVKINWEGNAGWGSGNTAGPLGMTPGESLILLRYCNSNCTPTADYEEAFKSVAVHEMGHRLGFQHEHQRDDRPALCENHTGGDWDIIAGLKVTPLYDGESIMNYCRRYDPTGGPTEVSPSGVILEHKFLNYQYGYHGAERLSAGDQYGAGLQYGRRIAYWQIPAIGLGGAVGL